MKRNSIAALVLSLTLCSGIIVLPQDIAQPLAITASAESADIAAPQNIKASSEDKKVNLTWDKVDGADAYAVYKRRFYLIHSKSTLIQNGIQSSITKILQIMNIIANEASCNI